MKFFGKPIKAFINTLTIRGRRSLDEPGSVLHLAQLEPLDQLVRGDGAREVDLVAEDEQGHLGEGRVAQRLVQLVARLVEPLDVRAVDHEDKGVAALVVMPPEWPKFVLSSNILCFFFVVVVVVVVCNFLENSEIRNSPKRPFLNCDNSLLRH